MGETIDRNSRGFLIHYAGVMEREANARGVQPDDWIHLGAAKARLQLLLICREQHAQGDLFS